MDLPKNFDEWIHCITVKCQIKLSKAFIEQRLAVYLDPENIETKKFTALYGPEHTRQTVEWLEQAKRRLP
jgi:hypothetical protein